MYRFKRFKHIFLLLSFKVFYDSKQTRKKDIIYLNRNSWMFVKSQSPNLLEHQQVLQLIKINLQTS